MEAAVNENEVTAPPARPRWRGRALLGAGAGLAGLVVGLLIGLAAGGTTGGNAKPASSLPTVSETATPPAPTNTPAPVPSPNATGQGTCDVSLASGINGTNYLVSEVDVTNTGNVGVVIRVRVSWPQVGFAPIVRQKTVQVPFGQTVHANLSVPADPNGPDIVGNFQNYQLSHNGDPCSYDLTVVSTFGPAH